ncbi:hypothetical protein QAD02_005080 [Eretmocerus hayati]|uniref:Uncharacterized protein n=1 Tax=Eretmocerus hayati TaxID=131215 RepID=A0ACC2NSL9_9HYME|nr:hypothetical protein QAD02_005080 [Eretmocerus hayati]
MLSCSSNAKENLDNTRKALTDGYNSQHSYTSSLHLAMTILFILLVTLGAALAKCCPPSDAEIAHRSFAVIKFGDVPLYSGVIVSRSIVLTINEFHPEVDNDDLKVMVDISSDSNSQKDHDVDRIIHPKDPNFRVTLLKLETPIIFHGNVGYAPFSLKEDIGDDRATMICWRGSDIRHITKISTEFRVVSPRLCNTLRQQESYPDNFICLMPLRILNPICAAGSFGGGIFVDGHLEAIVDKIPRKGHVHNVVEFYPKISKDNKNWIRQKIREQELAGE